MKIKPWQFLVFIFIPLTLILLSAQTKIFEPYEHSFYDFALSTRPDQHQSPNVALIKIDDATLQFLGQWPLPRDYHAVLVDILKEFNARAIFFDLIFSEASTYDTPFAKSIAQAGNVYLPKVFHLNATTSSSKYLLQNSTLLAPITPTLGTAFKSGHINTVIDSDGKIRKTLLFIKENGKLVPQLALQTACDYLDLKCLNIQFFPNEMRIDHTLRIPVSNFNEVLVNFPGRWENSFQHFSYIDILKTYDEYKNNNGPKGILDKLENKIFFIGLTATGTVDLRANPIENNYPMLGLNASLFNSVIQQSFIAPLSKKDIAILSALIFLLSLWLCFKFKPLVSFLGSLLLGSFYLTLAILLLQYYNFWIPMFLPMLIITLVYIVSASMRWFQESKKRQLLEKELLIASDIQEQFLIRIEKNIENFDTAVWFQPAKFVAGDLYDIFEIDEQRSGIFIGDVSGKGLPAALLMAQTISLFRIFSRQLAEPYAVLTDLNQALAERSAGRFVTGLYCIVNRERNRMQIASAGHEPLLIYRHKDKRLEDIPLPPNVPLGVMEDTEYLNIYTSIEKGDQLILLSDGIIEARNHKAEELGLDPIKQVILENAGKSAEQLLGCIKSFVLNYTKGEEQFDDVTIIVLSI